MNTINTNRDITNHNLLIRNSNNNNNNSIISIPIHNPMHSIGFSISTSINIRLVPITRTMANSTSININSNLHQWKIVDPFLFARRHSTHSWP